MNLGIQELRDSGFRNLGIQEFRNSGIEEVRDSGITSKFAIPQFGIVPERGFCSGTEYSILNVYGVVT